jgi:hypothetical protein
MLTLSYLFEITRWKQENEKGKLSDKGFETLRSRGLVKPLKYHDINFDHSKDKPKKVFQPPSPDKMNWIKYGENGSHYSDWLKKK